MFILHAHGTHMARTWHAHGMYALQEVAHDAGFDCCIVVRETMHSAAAAANALMCYYRLWYFHPLTTITSASTHTTHTQTIGVLNSMMEGLRLQKEQKGKGKAKVKKSEMKKRIASVVSAISEATAKLEGYKVRATAD